MDLGVNSKRTFVQKVLAFWKNVLNVIGIILVDHMGTASFMILSPIFGFRAFFETRSIFTSNKFWRYLRVAGVGPS
jgi:hypothetical protein